MIWFTSDEHYDHKNVIPYCDRPFKDIDEMREGLIERHNALVRRNDIVWHLGDFSFKKATVSEVVPRLNGLHYLVAGNHDICHPINCKSDEKKNRLRLEYEAIGFMMVYPRDVWCEEVRARLSHFPYKHSAHDERFQNLLPKDDGSWLLHGHVHKSWAENKRQINVGVDVRNYAPISLDEVLAIMKTRDLE